MTAPTPDQPTGMNELLNKVYVAGYQAGKKSGLTMVIAGDVILPEAEAAVQQIVERCLGQDENEGDPKDPNISDAYFYQQQRRNSLRAEIRHNLQQAGLLRGDDVTK